MVTTLTLKCIGFSYSSVHVINRVDFFSAEFTKKKVLHRKQSLDSGIKNAQIIYDLKLHQFCKNYS